MRALLRRHSRRLLAAHVLVPLLLAACTDRPTEPRATAPPTAPSTAPRLAVVDAARGAGTAGFYFLSPVAPTLASYPGTFDPGATPIVEVCVWSGGACQAPLVARYTTTGGTGGVRVQVYPAGQYYRVDWPVAGLGAGPVYRIRVLVAGPAGPLELGFADAKVPGPGETAAGLVAQGIVPLGNSGALAIRFRIELPAVLPGDAGAPAAVPARTFVPRPQDYRADHPQLPGLYLSYNTLLLVLRPGVTTAQASALLASTRAEVVGGIPGGGGAPGILFLRVPATTHAALDALLATLRADARVLRVARDGILQPLAVPRGNGGDPGDWSWEATPASGNWHLERSRVPQLWNLNGAVRKTGATAVVGVIDVGFAAHPDLAYLVNFTPTVQADHGTHVAGTIGATFDNGVGVDGVNPFARLVVGQDAGVSGLPDPPAGTPALDVRRSWGVMMIQSVNVVALLSPNPRVLNLSLGYNWYQTAPLVNPLTTPAAQTLLTDQGGVFDALMTLLRLVDRAPLVLVAGGNDSGGALGQQHAVWSSPMANAGIARGTPEVLVVEAVADAPAAIGQATRSDFSNDQGHLSAPGSFITSTGWTSPYLVMSGTSMATPFVTGLASYLLALDPALTNAQLRDLLLADAVPVAGGATPRVDAFASALDVDRVRGGDRVLRMLLDIDDGTLDGNQRHDPVNGLDVVSEDVDHDGGPGDGAIDMSDFRRWRDWLLQVENHAATVLDGTAANPKRDVNGNRVVQAPAAENVYPRGDFNGDGQLSRTATRAVPGVLGGAARTDLQVLQSRFNDPEYTAAELPDLIDSGDLTVDAASCLAVPTAVTVRSTLRETGTMTVPHSRVHTLSTGVRVYTVARVVAGYTARLEARDLGGNLVGVAERSFPIPVGGDAFWQPDCVGVTVTPASPSVTPGGTVQLTATVAGTTSTAVTWSASGGSVGPTGLYTAPAAPGSYTVRATSVAEPAAWGQVTVEVAPSATVTLNSAYGRVMVYAHAYPYNSHITDRTRLLPVGPYTDALSVSGAGSESGPRGSVSTTVSASASLTTNIALGPGSTFRSAQIDGTDVVGLTVAGSGTGLFSESGSTALTAVTINLVVTGGSAAYTLGGAGCAYSSGAGPLARIFESATGRTLATLPRCGGSASGTLPPGSYTFSMQSQAYSCAVYAGDPITVCQNRTSGSFPDAVSTSVQLTFP